MFFFMYITGLVYFMFYVTRVLQVLVCFSYALLDERYFILYIKHVKSPGGKNT